eukprot:14307475-Ditylum_brightwellii.AAC.1
MSNFYKTKNGMVEPTLEKFAQWEQSNRKVKFVRCNNAGESKTLEKRPQSKDWRMNLEFEYTARATLQQNYLAELAFAIMGNKGRTLMHQANVPEAMKFKVFPRAFMAATLLDGLMVVEVNGEKNTQFEHFSGKLPKFAAHLRTWGC